MEANLEKAEMSVAVGSEIEFKRRRWYHRRDLRFVVLSAILIGVFFSYGYITGPAKITDRLNAAIAANESAVVNIEVTARFPPEAFHMGIYQDVGSVRGSTGSVTRLNKVKASAITALSRKYWVVSIDIGAPTPPRR